MLTLTRDNLSQVLPLAEILRGRADLFTFNRLSLVGEGAGLKLPSKSDYIAFLEVYLEAANHNPVIALKDNLINITRRQRVCPFLAAVPVMDAEPPSTSCVFWRMELSMPAASFLHSSAASLATASGNSTTPTPPGATAPASVSEALHNAPRMRRLPRHHLQFRTKCIRRAGSLLLHRFRHCRPSAGLLS